MVHVGGRADAGARVVGVALCRERGGLRAVAGQGCGQHVDGGVGVGGLGGQDAVRVGFGGGQIDVVFHLPAGQRHVQQLSGQAIAADDVTRVPGGQALGGVDGGGVAEGDVGGDVARRQPQVAAGAQVSDQQGAVVAGLQDGEAVAVADEVAAA